MAGRAVRVEFFFAGGCSKCAKAREALREAAHSPRVQWKEIDIAKDPNRAVDVGVVSTPAVAIDGELIFKTMPTAAELRSAIRAREAPS
jgi:thioredoxin 1